MFFKPRPAKTAGAALYAGAVAQARTPALYTVLGVPDTREGRFELYSLHVILLTLRLKGEGEAATETSQALFDAYLRGLDDAFRELGVGDLSVGKKMKKLGEAFYGRLKAYETALADRAELESLLTRTVGETQKLAGYVIEARDQLARQPLETLLSGDAAWPESR